MNGIIIYIDKIQSLNQTLTNEQLGKLVRMMVSYATGVQPVCDDVVVSAIFQVFKIDIDATIGKYESICKRNQINGLRGGRPKKTQETQENPQNPVGFSKTQKTQKTLNRNININRDINNNTNSNSNIYIETKRKVFVIPSIDEIRAYINEQGLNVDADMFVDYYTANGWKAGRTPMRDWKATLRNWNRRNYGAGKATNRNDISGLANATMQGFAEAKAELSEQNHNRGNDA